MYSPKGLALTEPHLCPGIVNSSQNVSIHLLLVKLTAEPLAISKAQSLGYVKILESSDILSPTRWEILRILICQLSPLKYWLFSPPLNSLV